MCFLSAVYREGSKVFSLAGMNAVFADVKIRNGFTVMPASHDLSFFTQITTETVHRSVFVIGVMTGGRSDKIDKLNVDAKLPQHRGNVHRTHSFVAALHRSL